MLKTIHTFIQEEDSKLANYAVKHIESEDRMFLEEFHLYRLPFARDRDRLLHCKSFKRLAYKTQVFVNSVGDHFRTRLTHTLEVAAISRTISVVLGGNEYLAEVIALCHDIGHPPFGHAGQDILSELMRNYGGFEHNKQSLRVVTLLEKRYAEFTGLNLCKYTLVGIMKHGGSYNNPELDSLRQSMGPSLEAMITDKADEIAYNAHDIEDGIDNGYLDISQLNEVRLWKEIYSITESKIPNSSEKIKIRTTVRTLMNQMILDLATNTHYNLVSFGVENKKNLYDCWKQGKYLVDYSKELKEKVTELKKFLKQNLYLHPRVKNTTDNGKKIIESLFEYFIQNPNKIPEEYQSQLEVSGIHRAVCDYIAGMTDRYAEKRFQEII